MNIKFLQFIKTRTAPEIIISILSLIVGVFLTYDSIHFIYSYNFSSVLYCYMHPMTTLVSELFIGMLLTTSGLSFLIKKFNTTYLYKLSGIAIALYSINLNLLDLLEDYWSIQSGINFILIPIGVFIYLFFNQKRYIIHKISRSIASSDIIKTGIATIIFLIIDLSFYNWTYF